MAASIQNSSDKTLPRYTPDGRQTRIDFFRSGRHNNESHIVPSKKNSFEWWHALTGWLKSSGHEQEHHLEEFVKFLEQRTYSPVTCKSYSYMLRKFFDYMDKKEVVSITFGDIEDFNYDFFISGSYSRSYQLQFINALTLYLEFSHGIQVNLKGLGKLKKRR
jgi:hypothetical protein